MLQLGQSKRGFGYWSGGLRSVSEVAIAAEAAKTAATLGKMATQPILSVNRCPASDSRIHCMVKC